jgi:hypothetical protein
MKTDGRRLDVVVDDEVLAASHTSHILVEVVKLDETIVGGTSWDVASTKNTVPENKHPNKLAAGIRLHKPIS